MSFKHEQTIYSSKDTTCIHYRDFLSFLDEIEKGKKKTPLCLNICDGWFFLMEEAICIIVNMYMVESRKTWAALIEGCILKGLDDIFRFFISLDVYSSHELSSFIFYTIDNGRNKMLDLIMRDTKITFDSYHLALAESICNKYACDAIISKGYKTSDRSSQVISIANCAIEGRYQEFIDLIDKNKPPHKRIAISLQIMKPEKITHPGIIRKIVDMDLYPTFKDAFLINAVVSGDVELVKYILEKSETIRRSVAGTSIYYACVEGHTSILAKLLHSDKIVCHNLDDMKLQFAIAACMIDDNQKLMFVYALLSCSFLFCEDDTMTVDYQVDRLMDIIDAIDDDIELEFNFKRIHTWTFLLDQ